jgi:hypothetical protein
MKKLTIFLSMLLLICAISTLSFAQASMAAGTGKAKTANEIIKGKIISVDTAKSEVVVREKNTNAEKIITVDPKTISSLRADEEVKITLKAGTNTAESIKNISKVGLLTKKSGKKTGN